MNTMEIYGEEYLGREIRVESSTNPTLKGISGKVVKETKNTFSIKNRERTIMIPKSQCIFKLKIREEEVTINGKITCFKPENRLKDIRKISRNIRRME